MIEFWIDGCFLLEVMTRPMAEAYSALMSSSNLNALRAALAGGFSPSEIVAAARAQTVSPQAS